MTKESDGQAFNVELIRLYRDIMRLVEQATGMSQTRLEIIRELAGGERSQADLQQHLGVESPVVTRIIKLLEADGLVKRRPDPQDNRYTLVALTAQARQRHQDAALAAFTETFNTQLLAGLNAAERAELLRMMQRVSQNVRAVRTVLENNEPR